MSHRRRPSAHFRRMKVGKGRKFRKQVVINPHIRKSRKPVRHFGAQWKVGIASPFYKEGLAWTASRNLDLLSADTLGTIGEKNVPIETIEAPTQKEAIEEYKKLHPEFKKHFKQMDEEDVELSI